MALTPVFNEDIVADISEAVQPAFTWRVIVDGDDGMDGSIAGYTDEVEAIKQQVYLMLNTERGKYKIFGDSGYGIEKEDLIGMPIPYVIPEIDRRYREAIESIPEVESVGNFAFIIPEGNKDILVVQFTVSTIYGKYTAENGVAV